MSSVASFVRDRIGWEKHLGPFMEKRLPEGLPWTVTLGSVCTLLFAVMAATGIFLAMYYNPSPDLAYRSIDYIMKEVEMGPVLRGIHHWGASAMVILVFVHMMVSFFSGTFRKPRELTWMAGVCLFLLTLGFGFTGYLLPWDQKAYWATVVGTNIPRDIPLVGSVITRILLAGEQVSGLTLTRFFAIHMLVLPALTAFFIVFHIYLVRLHGVSDPEASKGEPGRKKEAGPYRFFPEHLARSSVAFGIVFLAILLFSVFAQIPREDVAGTVDPSYLPRPEWYYLWLFQMLTFFSGNAELIGSLAIPIGGVVLLFLVPFLGRTGLRRAADRPIATALGVAGLVGIVYLTLMGVAGARPYGKTITVPYRNLTASEKTGLYVFADRECAYCHHILGKGGRREGPDLANIAAKDRTPEYLRRFIRDPQAESRWSIMPRYDLSEAELNGLADFILSLDFGRHAEKTVSRDDALKGKSGP